MSTRSSIFLHEDPQAGVTIHIFRECASEAQNDVRLEVEFPQGCVNVPWPQQAFEREMAGRSVTRAEKSF